MIGQRLLHYELTAKLGEGGMGEVYRATDSKLGREVAIKVLPAAFVEDPERLARFEREARVLAALEHPNIAGIYGLEEVDGQQLLVMQLAEGRDLAAHLADGPIPLDRALHVALQIAAALEAAHARGIVHRDLKPANIMVSRDGSAKVLDFGLAKAWSDAPGERAALSMSPTLTAQMTQAGVILGTAGYMSPEQARGQEADHRSDIWSFGVVLHEMLTGERLFAADTVSDTLARVLMAEPDWDRVEADLPGAVAELLQRCLERDPSQRLQAIGEARIAIRRYLDEPTDSGLAPIASLEPGTRRPRRRLLGWIGLLGLVLLSAAIGAVTQRSRIPRPEPVTFSVQPPPDAPYQPAAQLGLDLSRDGRKLVYSAGKGSPQLFLKTLDEATPRPIPGTEGAVNPFFSPDGEWVAYFDPDVLMKVPLRGGNPIRLTAIDQTRGAVWLEDDTIVYTAATAGALLRLSATGGALDPLTTLDETRRERTHRWPSALPGGKVVLFTSDTFETTEYYDDARIEAVDVATGERKVLLEGSSMARYLPSGHLLYAQAGTLFTVAFDPRALEITGAPEVALQGVLTLVTSGAAQVAVSARGDLAYVEGESTGGRLSLAWTDTEGTWEPVQPDDLFYIGARLSPDGRKAAVVIPDQGHQDLWVLDLERDTPSKLSFGGVNADPVWSPDGKWIAFAVNDGDMPTRVVRKRADGTGSVETLWDRDWTRPESYHPDGRFLLVVVLPSRAEEKGDLWVLDLEGKEDPYPFLDGPEDEYMSEFSPDGRWVAYASDESGQLEVYVRPFPAAEGKWQISSGGGREPRWSPDGGHLFFRNVNGLYRVAIDAAEGFRAARPELFTDRVAGAPYSPIYSVAPDGEHVLMLSPLEENRQSWAIQVHLGWLDRLREQLSR